MLKRSSLLSTGYWFNLLLKHIQFRSRGL